MRSFYARCSAEAIVNRTGKLWRAVGEPPLRRARKLATPQGRSLPVGNEKEKSDISFLSSANPQALATTLDANLLGYSMERQCLRGFEQELLYRRVYPSVDGPNGGVKPRLHQIDRPRFSIMYQNQNGLAMNSQNPSKFYIIENKAVNSLLQEECSKSAGGKHAGNLHYVVENTCRKNARNPPFHYVDENKLVMAFFPLY